jgi:hypothetical protein
VYETPAEQAYGGAAYPAEPKHNDYYAHTGAQGAQRQTQFPPQELDGSAGVAEVHGESRA